MRDAKLHALRRLLKNRPRGRGHRLAGQVREEASAWAMRAMADGASVAMVARSLDVAPETVRRWRAAGKVAGTVAPIPVEVIEEVSAAGLRLVSIAAPGGYRVEGLTIEEAATLLRALR
jgi:hypothetical protein